MNIITDVNEWQAVRAELKDKTIGFIPTMGDLHEGHLNLCKRSKAENSITVVSIFVNPTQFNQQSDFDSYSRDTDKDAKLLTSNKIDFLLCPTAKMIYLDNNEIQVVETHMSLQLEGKFRLHHFKGVLTVVLKLLNIVQPNRAYFGEKDYQQLLLVKKMVNALFLPVEIIACPTVREDDGLAFSSRNSRLNPKMRKHAAHFPNLLKSELSNAEIRKQLEALGFEVDYIVEKWERRLGAVSIDGVRLIDNFIREAKSKVDKINH